MTVRDVGFLFTDTAVLKIILNTCSFSSSSNHLVARVYESKAEFRSALQHEKEGYTIYKNQVTQRTSQHGLCHAPFPIGRILNHSIVVSFLSGGRSAREDQGELRVPQVSHPAGCGSAEDHERDLQEWLKRQHHASQGEPIKNCAVLHYASELLRHRDFREGGEAGVCEAN